MEELVGIAGIDQDGAGGLIDLPPAQVPAVACGGLGQRQRRVTGGGNRGKRAGLFVRAQRARCGTPT